MSINQIGGKYFSAIAASSNKYLGLSGTACPTYDYLKRRFTAEDADSHISCRLGTPCPTSIWVCRARRARPTTDLFAARLFPPR